jgi:hypothetical protein
MRRFRNIFRRQVRVAGAPKTLFPPGHFYSPIVDVAELRSQQALGLAGQTEGSGHRVQRCLPCDPDGAHDGGGSLWIEKVV